MSFLPQFLTSKNGKRNVLFVLGGLLSSSLLIGLLLLGEIRLAVTASVLLMILGMAFYDVRIAIVGLFIYLTFMGDIRRMLVPISGWSGNDPLLMIAPLVTLLLFANALITKRLSLNSPIAKVTALFMVFMTLQIFNPKQGGLMVGIVGAMLYLIPMLWFWIGRAYATKDIVYLWLYRVMPTLAVIAALMGLYQVMYGWLPYQIAWFRVAGYSALGPSEDLLRSISIFPNLTEYLHYLGIVIVACMAALFKKQWTYALLIPLLFSALFLAGSRGPVLMVVLTASILFTVQGRSMATWAPRLALTLVIGVGVLVWGLSQAGEASSQMGNERMSHVMGRQADLIPSGEANAKGGGGTVAIHGNLLWLGIKWGFQEPLGRGIGSTTRAAAKFGDGGGSTEKDFTNMFVSGGVIGGFLYLAVIFFVVSGAIRYWQRERTLLALAIIGILAFTGMSWLKPGQYMLTPLIWLLIGALDRFSTERRLLDAQAETADPVHLTPSRPPRPREHASAKTQPYASSAAWQDEPGEPSFNRERSDMAASESPLQLMDDREPPRST